MQDNWFYTQQGQQRGPVPFAELQRMASTGAVRADDQVWSASLANWQPAGSIAGLFAPQPPPADGPGPAYGYSPSAQQPMGAAQPPLNYAGPMPQYGQPQQYDQGTRWLLPVGRSGWAIAAGYLGLLSIVLLPAPLAVIFSLIAIADLKRKPHLSGMGRAVFGLVMGLLFSVLLALLLLRGAVGRY